MPGQVLEAGISIMAQHGQTPVYGILLRRRDSKALWVLLALVDKGEADWIASEISRRLNVENAAA